MTMLIAISTPCAAQPPPEPAAEQQPQPRPADPSAQTPAESPPDQSAPPAGVQEVGGRLVVTGDTVLVVGDPDVPPAEASIASKTDTPIMDTPRSVSVTDRRTLDDRLAANVANAHDYTVGLMPADERGPAYARGFMVNFYDLRRDGLRTYAWSVREPVAVERVQYLRGPAALLYGDGSPGALVNMVLRKPLPAQHAELSASAGELGFARVTGDVTGPFTDSRRARYRLIGAAEWLENGFDNGERRLTLFPMAAFDIGRDATLTVDAELYHQKGRNYRHTVPVTADTQGGDFSKWPWDLGAAAPGEGWSGWNVSPGARLDMNLGAASSLHSAFRFTRIGGNLALEAALSLEPDGQALDRFNYAEDSTWQEWQSDTFVTTVRRTGPLEHRLVAGVEAGLSTAESLIGVGAAAPIDIHDPVYPPSPAAPAQQPTRYDVTRAGVYVQDQIRLSRAVILVPGLRWSRIGVRDRIDRPAIPDAERSSVENRLSPALGVVVRPHPWLSLYASGSQGFEPPAPGQYREDGRALSLADTSSIEAGIRTDAGGRLMASAAVFNARRTNVAEADGQGFYREIAEGRSHGVELEGTGRVADGLFLQAAYAWLTSEVARSDVGGVGNDLPNAPHHNASLWARYRVTDGRLAGAMVSAGVVHVSDRFIAADNVWIAPAYTRLDLSGSYELPRQHLRISAGLPNATNQRYVTSGAGQILWAGQPRRFVLQLTTWF